MENTKKSPANFAASVLNFAYAALVLNLLWNWFMTPLGVASIAYAHAAGLFVFFRFARGLVEAPKELAGEYRSLLIFSVNSITLFIGWILSQFI